MKRDGALLARIGTAMYGGHWLKPLSADLRVNSRTVRRWRDNDFDIPPLVWVELKIRCHQRADILRSFGANL